VRRDYIYLHKSLRSLHITRGKIAFALCAVTVFTGLIAALGDWLLNTHGEICRVLLDLAGIPIQGSQTLAVFPGLGPAVAPVVPVLPYESNQEVLGVFFIVSVLVLLAIYRRIALARNFVLFLITLLVAAAGVITFNPSFRFDALVFTQIWLRGEVLVWLLLPWVSAFLFLLIQPSVSWKLAWMALVQVYGFLWSAVRLAFCLAVLHYTGILFIPFLWFCLGLLADMLYVFVFYSMVVHQTCGKVWGERTAWQH